jgi:hypothetical protein
MQIFDSSSGFLVGTQGVTPNTSAPSVGVPETYGGGRRGVAQGDILKAAGSSDSASKSPVLGTLNDGVPAMIDEWLKANGYNCYGDPLDISYLGGTPLFNESTGQRYSRLGYILARHPHLRHLLPGREFSGCERPRPVEQPRPRDSRLSEIMKQIEELRAEIRKIWEALLRCGTNSRANRRLR